MRKAGNLEKKYQSHLEGKKSAEQTKVQCILLRLKLPQHSLGKVLGNMPHGCSL